ncbi:MAG: hypothetical protein QXS54_04815 [Candidatus Methanomethylicaceae archaeon]
MVEVDDNKEGSSYQPQDGIRPSWGGGKRDEEVTLGTPSYTPILPEFSFIEPVSFLLSM